MTFESFFPIIAIPLFAHSSLAFLQSFWKGASQYNDLLRVKIKRASGSTNVQQLLDTKLFANKICCRNMLSAVLIWTPPLRVIGVLPALLYLFFILLLIAKGIFKEDIKMGMELVSHILLTGAFLSQVLYVILKIRSNIPGLLKRLHPRYKNSSPLFILLDIVPLWKR